MRSEDFFHISIYVCRVLPSGPLPYGMDAALDDRRHPGQDTFCRQIRTMHGIYGVRLDLLKIGNCFFHLPGCRIAQENIRIPRIKQIGSFVVLQILRDLRFSQILWINECVVIHQYSQFHHIRSFIRPEAFLPASHSPRRP